MTNMSPGRLLLRLLLPVLLLTGCNPSNLQEQVKLVSAPASATEPSEPEVFVPPEPKSVNRKLRLELSLTLTDPTELKVKEGDEIAKGQILSERPATQQQLFQKAKLNTQLAETKTFLEEDQLRAAIAQLEAAQKLVNDFDASSPFKPGIDQAFIPISRTLDRNRLESQVREAAANVEALKVRVNERRRQAVSEQNQLLAQMKVIDDELDKLKVRSPYSGVIRRLKVERGTNNELIAKLKIQSGDAVKPNNLASTNVE